MDYISKIRENPLVRTVKIADLKHNSDLSRLEHVSESDKKRIQKYQIALDILTNY